MRRLSEHAFVFPDELRHALIACGQRRAGRAFILVVSRTARVQSLQSSSLRINEKQMMKFAHDDRRTDGDLVRLARKFSEPQHGFHELRFRIGDGYALAFHKRGPFLRFHFHDQIAQNLPVQVKEQGKEGGGGVGPIT